MSKNPHIKRLTVVLDSRIPDEAEVVSHLGKLPCARLRSAFIRDALFNEVKREAALVATHAAKRAGSSRSDRPRPARAIPASDRFVSSVQPATNVAEGSDVKGEPVDQDTGTTSVALAPRVTDEGSEASDPIVDGNDRLPFDEMF